MINRTINLDLGQYSRQNWNYHKCSDKLLLSLDMSPSVAICRRASLKLVWHPRDLKLYNYIVVQSFKPSLENAAHCF